MTPLSDDAIEIKFESIEDKIDNLTTKLDKVLDKVNSLQCPLHNEKINDFNRRINKIEDNNRSKGPDLAFISGIMGIILKAVGTIVAIILGVKNIQL